MTTEEIGTLVARAPQAETEIYAAGCSLPMFSISKWLHLQ